MGIESAPKQDTEEKPKKSPPPGKTDWSFVDKAREGTEPTPTVGPDDVKKAMHAKNEVLKKTILEQEYQKVKKQAQLFRAEHGITKTPDELAQEDRELRKKFGLE